MESRIEMLAKVGKLSALTGHRVVRVLPHDEIMKVAWSDETATLLIRRVRVREFRYQTCFDSADLVLMAWSRTASGAWSREEPVVMRDSSFTPYKRQEIGEVRDTLPQLKDRLEWEALCARPGDKSRLGGRDSFTRCTEAGSSESPMDSAWNQHRKIVLRSSTGD